MSFDDIQEDVLLDAELTVVDDACNVLNSLSTLLDDLADRSLGCYIPYTDYFDNLKYQSKKVIAALDKLEDRLNRAERDEILTLLKKY